jgi:urease accessory protein
MAVLATPAQAQAHLTAPGLNSFSSGLFHPWMTPAHVLVLLAIGLWIGQQVPLRLGMPCKVFGSLAAVALAVTTMHWIPGVPVVVLVGIAFVTGAIVALELRLPLPARAALLAAAAVAIGLDSGADSGGTGLSVFGTLAGTWVSLGLGLVNLAYYVSLAADRKEKWIRIAIRVAGSWIVAISLLMLAFAFRPHGGG